MLWFLRKTGPGYNPKKRDKSQKINNHSALIEKQSDEKAIRVIEKLPRAILFRCKKFSVARLYHDIYSSPKTIK